MITCLNMFPSKNRISSDLRPANIILGSQNPDYNKLWLTFWSICTGLHRHHQQYKIDNGRGDCTETSK